MRSSRITTHHKKSLGSLVGMLIISASSTAAQYQPADFGDALGKLSAQISLPENFGGDRSTIAVYCQADIQTTGVLQNTLCFESTGSQLKQQTIDALESTIFTAAETEGTKIPVRMQFRVIFSRSIDQPSVVLLPNLGTLQTQYGYDYIAPQERLDQASWFERYKDQTNGKGEAFFATGRLTRVIATVKIDGTINSVSTLEARGSGKRDAAVIESELKSSLFIPGAVGDEPIEMHYVAVLNYVN